MAIVLRDYQQEAVKLALRVRKTLMCMKVGSGKTLVSMFLCKILVNKKLTNKIVVACTKTSVVPFTHDFLEKGGINLSLITTMDEFTNFMNNKDKVCLIKHSFFEELGYKQDNIDYLAEYTNKGKKLTLIIDEAHKICNTDSRAHTAFDLIRFAFDRITLLTATPYSSCLSQFYGLIHLIYPKLWSSKRAFYDDHIEERVVRDRRTYKVCRKETLRYKNLKILREKVLPFTYFYYPPVKLHYVEHTTELKDYTEYDNLCKGVLADDGK